MVDNGFVNEEELLQKAEEALAEISRTQGLIDRHAEVLAAIRIHLYGEAPTLDDAIKAAGDLKGKVSLDNVPEKKKGSLDDALKSSPKKTDWPE
jgi:hypothetical protein